MTCGCLDFSIFNLILLLLYFYTLLDHSRNSPLESFVFLSSSSFLGEERFVGLRWNRSANVMQYTLSCPNKDCQNETLNGNVGSAILQVFTMKDLIVTLTAMYRCNTTTTRVTVPQVETTTSTLTTPTAVYTGFYSINCTYFLTIQREGGKVVFDNV